MMDCLWFISGLVGLVVLLRHTVDLVTLLWNANAKLDQFLYGSALVTGATDGIGKQFAISLAQRGFNLVLISRSYQKLQAVEAEIKGKFPKVEVDIIQCDFTECSTDPQKYFGELKERLSRHQISVLVNNVGIMHADRFEDLTFKEIKDMVSVNIYPQTFLSHTILPGMLERFKAEGKKSLILDLSSVAAILPLPGFSVYGATKAYNDQLAQSINPEVSNAVHVTSVRPGQVRTNLVESNNIPFEPGAVTTEVYVEGVLKNWRNLYTSGPWQHQIGAFIMEFIVKCELWLPVITFLVKRKFVGLRKQK